MAIVVNAILPLHLNYVGVILRNPVQFDLRSVIWLSLLRELRHSVGIYRFMNEIYERPRRV